ncbi:MAG TPA: hypothetical protein VGN60_01900 [Devosia sp.]|jgi:hypothetical protein|nr:hypothetical protein [Devosia sp.]
MAANLHLVFIAALSLFSVFGGALAFAQWSTRGMDVYRGAK